MVDIRNAWLLGGILPALVFLWWMQRHSLHPMPTLRRRALLMVRGVIAVLLLVALADPALQRTTRKQAIVFVLDHSHSLGESGMQRAYACLEAMRATVAPGTQTAVVSVGRNAFVDAPPSTRSAALTANMTRAADDGDASYLESGLALALGLFPAGVSKRIVLLSDGVQTRGDVVRAAQHAGLAGVTVDAVPIAGEPQPDVRVVRLTPSRTRLHEGAALELVATIESSVTGTGTIRLFENGIEVEKHALKVERGQALVERFRRAPEQRNMYSYQVRVEGIAGDTIPLNNQAMTLVDVRGRPVLLYIEGQRDQAKYLVDAMAQEGLQLQVRPPEGMPQSLQDLAPYDGLIISDVPAHKLSEHSMALVRDYVEQLGGGFLMVGGKQSFGVGGYYRTPIEDILPVKMRSPDQEESKTTALALVVDRSGSMSGQKIEICKSAAVSTADLLSRKDYLGVVAFDSSATWIVPMTRVSEKHVIASRIGTINAGGGTNIRPGMELAQQGLGEISARIKHMIVLTDGHTGGQGYQALATAINGQSITISTVAVGAGADVPLLQSIAAAGGGKFYLTTDPAAIPRIFTQDTMIHSGRLIHEEAFTPQQVADHPMLKGWDPQEVPPLLGYVKTTRKATAQVPLVTERNDPLLAHWRFGLGKVTAFTSDCKSNWASLWLTGWTGYGRFWGQVLREMAREPGGYHADVAVRQEGDRAWITVELLEDMGHFNNSVSVTADIFFLPEHALGSALQHLATLSLNQEGPGRYGTHFDPTEPGVYLVRARAGAELVSAGFVFSPSNEAATGQVDRETLQRVCDVSGGRLLDAATPTTFPGGVAHSHYVEMKRPLLILLLLLFMADIVIRRWEHLLGALDWRHGKRA